MAKVLLCTVAPPDSNYATGAYRLMVESQQADRFGVHTLTDDPGAADVILFVEIVACGHHCINIRRHPLTRRFREKCFLSDPSDRAIPFLPGIYAAIEKRWHSPGRTRSGPYPGHMENPFMEDDPGFRERTYLYSFIGNQSTWPLRARLAELGHPRGFFEDRSSDSLRIRMTGTPEEVAGFNRHYADVAKRSHFVLCPRGVGASSIRLFETMRAGRAPVILSDAWVPPEGPAWERFSLRVPERDWATLPALLEAREGDAAAMGRLAREAWEEWFAPPVLFHRTVEKCLAIRRDRRLPERLASLWVWPQVVLRPFHLRILARRILRRDRS